MTNLNPLAIIVSSVALFTVGCGSNNDLENKVSVPEKRLEALEVKDRIGVETRSLDKPEPASELKPFEENMTPEERAIEKVIEREKEAMMKSGIEKMLEISK